MRVKLFKYFDDLDKSIFLVFMLWYSFLLILLIFILIIIGYCVFWVIKKLYFKFILIFLVDNVWNKVLSLKKMWKFREKKERIIRFNININVVIYKLIKFYI